MNSKNSKICDPHRLDEKKEEKINIFLYQILVFTIDRKILKSHIRIINLKYQLQHGMKNLNHLMDHIPYIHNYFEYMFKKHGKKTINTSIRIYKNKIENRITFKIKSGYYVELLTLVTMKLLGSTKSKITKDKKGENVPYLEINEVVLIHCNVVNNSYQQNSRVLSTFASNKSFGQLLHISPENVIFLKTFDLEFLYIEVSYTETLIL